MTSAWKFFSVHVELFPVIPCFPPGITIKPGKIFVEAPSVAHDTVAENAQESPPPIPMFFLNFSDTDSDSKDGVSEKQHHTNVPAHAPAAAILARSGVKLKLSIESLSNQLGCLGVSEDQDVIVMGVRARMDIDISELQDSHPKSRNQILVDFLARHAHLSLSKTSAVDVFGLEQNTDQVISSCGVYMCSYCGTPAQLKKRNIFALQTIYKHVSERKLHFHVDLVKDTFTLATLSDKSNQLALLLLPDTALMDIMSKLDPRSMSAMSSTCKYLYYLSNEIVPGLRLNLFEHQRKALRWMLRREAPEKTFVKPWFEKIHHNMWVSETKQQIEFDPAALQLKDVRGGLLCDEPGLGKTITVLALILKTKHAWSGERFDRILPGATDSITSEYATKEETIKMTAKWALEVLYNDKDLKGYIPTYMKPAHVIIGNKRARELNYFNLTGKFVDLRIVKENIENDVYNTDFKLFLEDVERVFDIWLQLYPDPEHVIHKSTSSLKDFFLENIIGTLPDLLKKTLGILDDTTHLESTALLSQNIPGLSSHTSFLSAATQTVTRDKRRRISKLRLELFEDYQIDIFQDEETDESDTPSKKRKKNKAGLPINYKMILVKSLIYFSGATLVVAPAELITHWTEQINWHVDTKENMRILHYRKAYVTRLCLDAADIANNYDLVFVSISSLQLELNNLRMGDSLLHRIHWFRIVVDEGHTLGSSLGLTNRAICFQALRGTRKWIMTGTPTPNKKASALSHMWPLLNFIGIASSISQRDWSSHVSKPFETKKILGVRCVTNILSGIMCRNSKENISLLPKLHTKEILLPLSKYHAQSYNRNVETIRRNLLLCDFNDSNHEESLLNVRNVHMARTALRSLQEMCNVAGKLVTHMERKSLESTLEKLATKGHDDERIREAIGKFREGSCCELCGTFLHFPIITLCLHVLCVDCTAKDRFACPQCRTKYEMQYLNHKDRLPVPRDLIEAQPAYEYPDWEVGWEEATASAKGDYVVKKIKEIRARTYWDFKARKTRRRNEKVIIYSQLISHIYAIIARLKHEKIPFATQFRSMERKWRDEHIQIFKKKKRVNVLVMDATGALGHDLSFVNHVFLMEPIWDKSVELQVISRAHRIGAKEKIIVEKLAIRGTIEESMLQFRHDTENEVEDGTVEEKSALERRRAAFGLSGLKAVVPSDDLIDNVTSGLVKDDINKGYGWWNYFGEKSINEISSDSE